MAVILICMSLTPKQQRFVAEYLVDLNATQAAIRAGYSARTANRIASENLSKPDIKAAIAAAAAARGERTAVTADRVLAEIARIAFVDPRGYYDAANGKLKPLSELTAEQAAALASIETLEEFGGRGEDRVQVGVTQKVRFWPKVEALRLAAQHLGMLIDKKEITGKDGGPIAHEHVISRIDELAAAFESAADRPG